MRKKGRRRGCFGEVKFYLFLKIKYLNFRIVAIFVHYSDRDFIIFGNRNKTKKHCTDKWLTIFHEHISLREYIFGSFSDYTSVKEGEYRKGLHYILGFSPITKELSSHKDNHNQQPNMPANSIVGRYNPHVDYRIAALFEKKVDKKEKRVLTLIDAQILKVYAHWMKHTSRVPLEFPDKISTAKFPRWIFKELHYKIKNLQADSIPIIEKCQLL